MHNMRSRRITAAVTTETGEAVRTVIVAEIRGAVNGTIIIIGPVAGTDLEAGIIHMGITVVATIMAVGVLDRIPLWFG